jgi:glyoxylase-like metal-dependent hydrolase (beta-lactamase superfamily II)
MKLNPTIPESKHLTLERLSKGIYACIHKPGGGAYSNAGIIDLGDRTLLVDAFDTMAAGLDLRQTAEALFNRPVDTIVLTHPHSDHWVGASAFEDSTVLLASKTTRQVSHDWGEEIVEGNKDPAAWQEWLEEIELQAQTEKDERVLLGLKKTITRTRYAIAEMAEFQPRYADRTYKDTFRFRGDERSVELRSLGRGHSEDDAVLLLPQDRIAFIGDVGFFDTQPFLGYCDLGGLREQMRFFQESDYEILVPGHGPVGNKYDLTLQHEYLDIMENLVGDVAQRGGSLQEALQITLPDPFDKWLMGGMARFEANVRYLFAHFDGEVLEEE